MNPWIVLPQIVVLAVVFVMLPVGAAVYAQYRRRKLTRCPVTGGDVVIRVDAAQAGLNAALGRRRLSIAECSLWPARQGCGQVCLTVSAETMPDAPAVTAPR